MQMPRAFRAGRRAGFLALGGLMLALGIVGAFLPVMPTTIFLIVAAWCFGRSSPRLEAWMLDHPRFGLALRQWREEGAVPLRAKLMAVFGDNRLRAVLVRIQANPTRREHCSAVHAVGCGLCGEPPRADLRQRVTARCVQWNAAQFRESPISFA